MEREYHGSVENKKFSFNRNLANYQGRKTEVTLGGEETIKTSNKACAKFVFSLKGGISEKVTALHRERKHSYFSSSSN